MPIEYICRIVTNSLLCSAPLIIAWCVGRSVCLRHRADQGTVIQRAREAWLWFLVIYLILLIQITVFRFGVEWPPSAAPRVINDQPLVTLRLLKPWAVFYNVAGNIVWFVPLGLALPAVCRGFCHPWRTVLAGCGLSLVIEGLQYLFGTGISDVDDVIFNTLGALAGWLLFACGGIGRRMRHKSRE